ncbi:MAG: L-histidine N(alpha)-methyltransferase [Cytophagales bacterium]|uniref:L-histidine N(Alpha)-methyltransferase n=1 Tax=Algoriphagus taiwanensis TaxID=1445656 RepID=A0ABQ6Q3I9_9BACT|nr:MAG: L-histidine N(alpha)-methyltransferase [Cytophagales bacterium]GMQ34745.1 L-histidine N(alpha)-methyltransferase [Algoriphagus taiwanensis]
MNDFENDVLEGLGRKIKSLPSKYFYDSEGSRIFQEIMDMPEYYLPRAEMEIIHNQSEQISQKLRQQELDVIELGAGDGRKMVHFLRVLSRHVRSLTYFPLDISESILRENEKLIKGQVPDIQISPLVGDYFQTLQQIREREIPRVILFAGSNIGNFPDSRALVFLEMVKREMKSGDCFLLGVDLKKHPKMIWDAYSDPHGITARFNLNLLKRINRELDADFEVSAFDHFATYHPLTGAAESFLVSLKKQKVNIRGKEFEFQPNEVIQTEISQKYDEEKLMELAQSSGLTWDSSYSDSQSLFSWVLFKR